MYNVLEKLRNDEALTVKEREIHQAAACGVLRELHEELDQLVAAAYGWAWPMSHEEILEHLVKLHGQRVEEEKRGLVRWLRPEYQIPRYSKDTAATPEVVIDEAEPKVVQVEEFYPWPARAAEQITAVYARVNTSPATPHEVAAAFIGARPELVRRHLETLVEVGEVRALLHDRYEAVYEPI